MKEDYENILQIALATNPDTIEEMKYKMEIRYF